MTILSAHRDVWCSLLPFARANICQKKNTCTIKTHNTHRKKQKEKENAKMQKMQNNTMAYNKEAAETWYNVWWG